jgi:hypothetical protein
MADPNEEGSNFELAATRCDGHHISAGIFLLACRQSLGNVYVSIIYTVSK